MDNKLDILEIAKTQLAKDYNCKIEDLNKMKNTIVENKLVDGRRVYDSDGCFFRTLCFGGKVIINAEKEIITWCGEKFLKSDGEWFFEYPNLKEIDKKLMEFGHEIADIHHYYIPKVGMPEIVPITNIKWYEQEDILQFKDDNRFGQAFVFDERTPDVLAIAAFDNDCIIGMASATEDSETMWQIGIDVVPQYRGRGIASNLVGLLKQEVMKRGKVPFYGTVESHLNSQNVAIKAGFVPTWAELYSKVKEDR